MCRVEMWHKIWDLIVILPLPIGMSDSQRYLHLTQDERDILVFLAISWLLSIMILLLIRFADLWSRGKGKNCPNLNIFHKKRRYLPCSYSDKGLKVTVVNRTCHDINGGLLDIKPTVHLVLNVTYWQHRKMKIWF